MATAWQAEVIARLHKAFQPEAAAGEQVACQLVLVGDPAGEIWMSVRDGRLETGEGRMPVADVTFELGHGDLLAVLGGASNPDLLFMEERIRVEGELSLALKLRKLFRAPA